MTVHARIRPAFVRVLLPAAVIAPLLVGTPARADHVPGGSYSGPVTLGGTVSFTVSADGTQVTNFTASGVPCMEGGTGGGTIPSMPIDPGTHLFSGSAGALGVSGGFGPGGTAGGTLFLGGMNCHQQSNWQGELGPCKCVDARVNTEHRKNIFSFDERAGFATSFFRATKTVFCAGKTPPGCQAKLEIQVAQGSKGNATVPKSERKVKCNRDDCPPSFQKKFEWRLRVFIDRLPGKGKIKKIRLRYKIECDEKTIFIPMVIAIKPSGRVDRGSSDFGNPA